MKTIGLIEDNECLRAVFAAYFNSVASFKVAFAVGDFKEALAIKGLSPHIILLDVDLPSGSGIDAIPALHGVFPDAKIVILSNLKDAALTKRAVQNGASGYLLKSNSVEYIHESLMHLDNGGLPFSPETISHLVKQERAMPDYGLTKRELEIVKLVCQGKLNKQVADTLCISYLTVNQHVKNTYKKLNVSSKAELVAWYLSYAK